jgi:nucleotide-binding universal stress UspA family protein
VLAATDFSDASDAALRQALDIAHGLQTRLVVCHVLPEAYRVRMLFPQDAGVDTATQEALETKAREAIRLRLEGLSPPATAIETAIELESGSPHAGILQVAARIGAGLIATGPGPTAQHIARATAGPLLVARPSPVGGTVLGASDFSDPALPAVHMAAAEAARRRVKLRLVHCLDIDATAFLPPSAVPGLMHVAPLPQSVIDQMETAAREQLATAVASAGTPAEAIVDRSAAVFGILSAADAVATSLIVVGTRGRTGLARLALGSVAEAVMARASCSVLVVPLHPAE